MGYAIAIVFILMGHLTSINGSGMMPACLVIAAICVGAQLYAKWRINSDTSHKNGFKQAKFELNELIQRSAIKNNDFAKKIINYIKENNVTEIDIHCSYIVIGNQEFKFNSYELENLLTTDNCKALAEHIRKSLSNPNSWTVERIVDFTANFFDDDYHQSLSGYKLKKKAPPEKKKVYNKW